MGTDTVAGTSMLHASMGTSTVGTLATRHMATSMFTPMPAMRLWPARRG